MESIDILGHIFNADGVCLNHERVQEIEALPDPTLEKEFRSLTRLVNYFETSRQLN